jgi:hypothetical protein
LFSTEGSNACASEEGVRPNWTFQRNILRAFVFFYVVPSIPIATWIRVGKSYIRPVIISLPAATRVWLVKNLETLPRSGKQAR